MSIVRSVCGAPMLVTLLGMAVSLAAPAHIHAAEGDVACEGAGGPLDTTGLGPDGSMAPSREARPRHAADDRVLEDGASEDAEPFVPYRSVSRFWVPLGGWILPGFGQAMDDRFGPALLYAVPGVGGYGVVFVATSMIMKATIEGEAAGRWPEVLLAGSLVGSLAGGLSVYDSYRYRSTDLLPARASTAREVLSGPWHFASLRRPAVAVPVGLLAGGALVGVSAVLWHEGRPPFQGIGARDVWLPAMVPYSAAVAEEALFRGFLLSYLHNVREWPFWLANGLQALVFGLGHYLPGEAAAVVWSRIGLATLAGAGLGHVVRTAEYDLRPAVFAHFWWNTIVIAASLALGESPLPMRVGASW